MANQGHWTNSSEPSSRPDQGTLNLMNSMLVQLATDSSKDGTLGDTGRVFFGSDTKKVYRDSGSAWVVIIETDPATGTAGLRTLGTGSAQAAAGNHTH
jgi:hypothetical protein